MRRAVPLLALGLVALAPSAVAAAVALVQRSVVAAESGSVASINRTFPGAVTAGNTLIAVAAAGNCTGKTLSASDDNANTYQSTTQYTGADKVVRAFWVTAPTLTINPPTVTISSTGSCNMNMSVREYSGLAPVPQDGSAGVTTVTAINPELTDALTTTGARDLLVAGFVDSSAATNAAGAGWGNADAPLGSRNYVFEDQLNVVVGAYQGACIPSSANTGWLGMIAAFKVQSTMPSQQKRRGPLR